VTWRAFAIAEVYFDLLAPPVRDTHAYEIMQALAVIGSPRLNFERRAPYDVLALQPEGVFECAIHRYVSILPILCD
jgi:hypothetical protein